MRRSARIRFAPALLALAACTGPAPRELDTAAPEDRPQEPTATAAPSAPSTQPEALTAAPPAEPPLLRSKRRHVWVRSSPSTRANWIGYLGLGDAVALRDSSPVRGDGCAKFLPVEPRGYVCADERTTLDADDAEYQAIRKLGAPRPGPWPFEYGEARETPRYWSVPSLAEQRRREWRLDEQLATVARMREGAISEDAVPTLLRGVDPTWSGQGPEPALLQAPAVREYRLHAKAGSSVSWVSQFDAEGRTWLVTPDLALMPKDKVAPYARSPFQGLRLGAQEKLPTAFVRHKPARQLQRSEDGSFRALDTTWPRLAHVRLTGNQERDGRRTLLETAEAGLWLEQDEAAVATPASWTPWGERIEGSEGSGVRVQHRRPPPASSRGTWVEVSVHGGWMIAYERTRPVFVTLVSPGRGRTLRKGDPDLVESATPPGVYDIRGKYRSSTMAVTEIVHFDVTFAMPFAGTIAFHSAYWHDRWGEKASMGCVNLSPADAMWLFEWAEPQLPAGWHGVSANESAGYATIVVVHG